MNALISRIARTIQQRSRGVTLVELIVTLAIFGAVTTVLLGSFITLFSVREQTDVAQRANDDIRVVLDNIEREVQAGNTIVASGDTLQFTVSSRDDKLPYPIAYRKNGGTIEKAVGKNVVGDLCAYDTSTMAFNTLDQCYLPITGPGVNIQVLSFSVSANSSEQGQTSPLVTIGLSGAVEDSAGKKTPLNYSTSITPRNRVSVSDVAPTAPVGGPVTTLVSITPNGVCNVSTGASWPVIPPSPAVVGGTYYTDCASVQMDFQIAAPNGFLSFRYTNDQGGSGLKSGTGENPGNASFAVAINGPLNATNTISTRAEDLFGLTDNEDINLVKVPPFTAPATVSLTASCPGGSCEDNEQITLQWTPTNANGCTASNAWVGNKTFTNGPHNEAIGPYGAGTHTFRMDCTGAGGDGNDSVMVIVNPAPPATYTLTVSKAGVAASAGTISSNPVGINCGADCSEAYATGLGVSLSSSITNGSVVYSGDCVGVACNVTMNANKSVTATFSCNGGFSWNGSACLAGTPTVTLPTAISISTTGATLGATVTSNGGSALTSRGTCWGTTANPASNCSPEGGTAVSIFSHARAGMSPGTTYYYRGYATNGAGNTGYSSDGSFVTVTNAPAAPSVTPQACGTGQNFLDWADVAGATSYSIYNADTNAWIGNSGGSNYTHTGAQGTLYRYYVRANNSAGAQSANSPTVSGTTAGACAVPPSTPTNFKALPDVCGNPRINLEWDAMPGATSYDVSVDGGAWFSVGTDRWYYHLGLVLGSSHSYRVRAVNGAGNSPVAGPIPASAPSACAATYTLTINSSGAANVVIGSATGDGGTTNYSRPNKAGSYSATLTAPATSGANNFSSWTGCTSVAGTTCTISMNNANQTVTANYAAAAPTCTLGSELTGVAGVLTSEDYGPDCQSWVDYYPDCLAPWTTGTVVTLPSANLLDGICVRAGQNFPGPGACTVRGYSCNGGGGPILPIVTLSTSANTITAGQAIVLSRTVSNADSCIAASAGTVATTWTGFRVASNMFEAVTLNTAGSYTFSLSCTNSSTGLSDSATPVLVTVNPAATGVWKQIHRRINVNSLECDALNMDPGLGGQSCAINGETRTYKENNLRCITNTYKCDMSADFIKFVCYTGGECWDGIQPMNPQGMPSDPAYRPGFNDNACPNVRPVMLNMDAIGHWESEGIGVCP